MDAFGQQLHKVLLRAFCLNSLPVTDKRRTFAKRTDSEVFMTRKYLAGWSWSLPCRVICGMFCSILELSVGWTEAMNAQGLVWIHIGRRCARHCWVVAV